MTRISTARLYLAAIALPLVAPGCVLGSPSNRGSDSSTGTASTSTAGATSTSDTSHPTSSGDSDSGASASSSSSGVVFIPPTDHPSGWCDARFQDCPAGQKCMPYADDGGGSWNDTRCVPVMENPAAVGEPCFVVGSNVSGIDNCELGAMCWAVNEMNMGVCIALCSGPFDSPICPDDSTCDYSRSADFGVCISDCDPLIQDCDPGDACIANTRAPGFRCVPDASGREGQAHDTCNFANACDPGLMCADATAAKECDPQAQGCCEPFCDLTAPNTCPGEDQVCTPIPEFEDYENIGHCSVATP